MSASRSGWFAAAGQVVGSPADWSTSYIWDGQVHRDPASGVHHRCGTGAIGPVWTLVQPSGERQAAA